MEHQAYLWAKLAKDMTRLKDPDLWVALVLILFTIYLSFLIYVNKQSFNFFVGSLRFYHWLSLIGGFWIAFVTPAYYVLKHRRPKRIRALLRVHMFGNLLAFMLISVHFTYEIISVSFMGTGLALFIAVLALVVTGLLQRFNIMTSLRGHIKFIHISMTTAFYLILIIHVLSRLIRI
jgi:hypothetical protein